MSDAPKAEELSVHLTPSTTASATSTPSTPPATTANVNVTLIVRNQSSHVAKSGGTWSVKDETPTPPVIASTTFNRIPPGVTDMQSVSLPTGFEWGAFRFEHEGGGGQWTSIHGGNNTVKITLNLLNE